MSIKKQIRLPDYRILIILVTLVIAGAAVLIINSLNANHGPIPSSLTKHFTFSIYYPYDLPAGYSVDTKSFDAKGNVLIFSINSPIGKNIAVSEEPVPNTGVSEIGPPDDASGSPVDTTEHFTVPAGTADIGLWGANFVSSIVAGQTWLILNANGFTYTQAAAVSRSFTPLR